MAINLDVAISLAKQAFDASLPFMGRPAQWSRRTAAVPQTTGSDRSAAFGQRDVLVDWVNRHQDPALFDPPIPLYLTFERPSGLLNQEAVNLLSGQALAYLCADSGVSEGDMITVDGVAYDVTAVRLPSPPVYLTATLQRTP
jgi:hypothetical protein